MTKFLFGRGRADEGRSAEFLRRYRDMNLQENLSRIFFIDFRLQTTNLLN